MPADSATHPQPKRQSWLAQLFDAELPAPASINDGRWRLAWKIFLAVFAVQFSCFVVIDAIFNHNIMMGPGLVDTGQSAFNWALQTLSPMLEQRQFLFIGTVSVLCLAAMLINSLVTYRGFTRYRDHQGRPFPLHVMQTFLLLNGVMVGMMVLMLALCGIAAWLLGYSFADGMAVIRWMTQLSHSVVAQVPTLIHLPYPLPLFAAMLAVDFFLYWFHRLGHTRRSMWLLWHRPHHMTPVLIHPTTQPVFAAFPLFLLFSVPFQLMVGVLAKIFGPETMIMEAILLRAFLQCFAPYAHNSAYYHWFAKSRFRMLIGKTFGLGNYHYMHHSALPGHEAINLGGNLYYFWDRLFGTYVEPSKEKPPVGLTGQPELHMNPLRLALSGLAQLLYEWRHNPDWKTRAKILLGSSGWTPPVTKDYAIKTR